MVERSHRAANLPTVGPHQSCTDLIRVFPWAHAAISRIQCRLPGTPRCRPAFHPAMSKKTTWNQPNAPHAFEQVRLGWDEEHRTPARSVPRPMADSIPTRRHPNARDPPASPSRVCIGVHQTLVVVHGKRRLARWASQGCISTARGSMSKSTSLGFGPTRCPRLVQAKDCLFPWSNPE